MVPAPRGGGGGDDGHGAAIRFVIESGEYVATGGRKRDRRAEQDGTAGTGGVEERAAGSGRGHVRGKRKSGRGRSQTPPPPPMQPPPHLVRPADDGDEMDAELPPLPPPETTPPARMAQVESQRHADAMSAEALRLATEAAQLEAAAVLMRAMSMELERHQSGLGGVGEAREVVLGSEIPVEAGDGGGSQTGAMELETQIGASSTVGNEAQGPSMDESEMDGGGRGRRKRTRPRVHNNRAAHGGQHRREEGRYKREKDGREG